MNARLDELGKSIRELESQLLKNEKALGRRKKATSDPPKGPVRTGTKSATSRDREVRVGPHPQNEWLTTATEW